jgi:hypothetical protein
MTRKPDTLKTPWTMIIFSKGWNGISDSVIGTGELEGPPEPEVPVGTSDDEPEDGRSSVSSIFVRFRVKFPEST